MASGNGLAAAALVIAAGKGGSGTKDYNALENKPQINGVMLAGNKSVVDLNMVDGDSVVVNSEGFIEAAEQTRPITKLEVKNLWNSVQPKPKLLKVKIQVPLAGMSLGKLYNASGEFITDAQSGTYDVNLGSYIMIDTEAEVLLINDVDYSSSLPRFKFTFDEEIDYTLIGLQK